MSGNANVTGTLPTTRTDGTAVTAADIASVNIYRAAGTAAPVKVGVATIAGLGFSYADTGLAPGAYNYGATAVDASGVESAVSNLFPAVIAAPVAALSPPTIVNVVVS
jgi:hypothetical protein